MENSYLFRKMKMTILVTFVLFLPAVTSAQEFMKIVEKSKNKKFDEIVKEVEHYFDSLGVTGQDEEEGHEYFQFLRWKYFNESRLTDQGRLQNINQRTLQELERYRTSTSGKGLRVAAAMGNWQPLGPLTVEKKGAGHTFGIGRVNCLTSDPGNDSILYAGTPAGGLWRSMDGGTTWSNGLTDSYLATIGVSGIAIDPASPPSGRTIYILTGDGDGGSAASVGVLKSSDNGTTWQQIGLSFDVTELKHGYKLLMHPDNNNILFAAMSDGLYRSTDGGATWALQFQNNTVQDIEFQSGNPSIVFCSVQGKIYRSTDVGANWTEVTSGLNASSYRRAIAVTPANPDYVYVLDGGTSSGAFGGLYKSTDGGLSFSLQSSQPNILGNTPTGNDGHSQSSYDLALTASPLNAEEIHVGGINCWKSQDGGVSWANTSYWVTGSTLNHYTHADIHALEFIGDKLFCGSDGGVFVSPDHADNWYMSSYGLSISQFYRLGVDPYNANRIVCGAQDNGMNLLRSDVLDQWFEGDGFEGFVDYVDTSIIYGESQNGGLVKSVNNGQSIQGIRPTATNATWNAPFVMDPQDHNTLYAGYVDVWKTNDAGQNWTNITSGKIPTGEVVDFIAIAPSNPDYIYTILDYRNLFRSRDGGNTWEDMNTFQVFLPSTVSYIAVNPANPEEVWVSCGNYDSGRKVFRTLDGGSNWTNESGTLPNVPANCIQLQQGTSGVYVGTDIGVFYRDSTMTDWSMFSEGLPYTIVTELEFFYPEDKLRASTYGRGIWESSPVVASSNKPPVAVITSPPDHAVFSNPATFMITTDVSDSDGVVRKVEFFEGDVKLGEDITVPFSFTWDNVPAGNYSLTVRATDNLGAVSVSPAVTVTVGDSVLAPVVSIISPVNNATFTAPATIAILADASVPNGTIRKVEFFEGAVKLGEDSITPYSFSWTGAPAGDYSLTALATGSSGASSLSDTIHITVHEAIICLSNEPVPDAGLYIVRNSWSDNYAGAGVSNDSNAMMITQRAWGKSDLWVMEEGKTIDVISGQSYTIQFDFKDFFYVPVTSIDVGFGSGYTWSGPILTQPKVTLSSGFTFSDYGTQNVNITAASSGSVNLVFHLNWGYQPTQQIVDYIKNISVCTMTQPELALAENAPTTMSVYPNPAEEVLNIRGNFGVSGEGVLQIRTLQGILMNSYTVRIYEGLNTIPVRIGELPEGMYLISIRTSNSLYSAGFSKL